MTARNALAQGQMASLDLKVIDTPPKFTLQTSHLFKLLLEEDGLVALVNEIRDQLGNPHTDLLRTHSF